MRRVNANRKRELAYIRLVAQGVPGRSAALAAGYAHAHYSWYLNRRLADEIEAARRQMALSRRGGNLANRDAQVLIDTVLSLTR